MTSDTAESWPGLFWGLIFWGLTGIVLVYYYDNTVREVLMPLHVDAHRSLPIGRPLTEPLEHVIESGGVLRDQARPSVRELAGFLGINPNTVARAIEDLKRSGYRPLRPSPGGA
jgi:hypothetical protein